MSGALSLVGSGLSTLASLVGSRARLQPASFRGVPFIVSTSGGSGGRRRVTHEFPLRDTPYLEDLGRLPRHFKLRAFVIDNDDGTYLDQRDALIDAVEGYATAATLVHPTFGSLTVRAGVIGWTERIVESFGWCEFDLDFMLDGAQPSPTAGADTASALLAGVASLLPLISQAYETLVLGIVAPGALLSQLGEAMLGLPPGTVLGLTNAIAAVSASPGDVAATAAAVQAATQAMATNIIASQASAATTDDPVAGTAFTIAAPSDPSGGLATLATWGSTLPAIATTTAIGADRAAQQAAVVALAQGNAVAALTQVYASADWPTSDAATTARGALLGLLDAQTDAAAAAGADDLYRAWRAMTALAMADMISRAQSLPSLGYYGPIDTLPSLVLAQYLYADPTQAPALEQLLDVAHPLFMPPQGRAIVLPDSVVGALAPVAPPPVFILPPWLTASGVPLTVGQDLIVLR